MDRKKKGRHDAPHPRRKQWCALASSSNEGSLGRWEFIQLLESHGDTTRGLGYGREPRPIGSTVRPRRPAGFAGEDSASRRCITELHASSIASLIGGFD